MILTVTMNPAVDVSYPLNKFQLDRVNRCNQTKKTAGGKGLNVTRVIHLMNEDVIATGILGGTTGEFIINELYKSRIKNDFLKTNHESRNCIAILHDGKQTEILESGPTLSFEDEQAFLEKFEMLVKKATLVSISGSLPKGMSLSVYSQLISIANKYQVKTLLDCSGETLKQAIIGNDKPYLIKPNQEELSQLLKIDVTLDFSQIKEVLKNDMFHGIEWIVVSLGAAGAVVKVNDSFYTAKIPTIHVVNPVGSGDATLAGLAVAINNGNKIEEVIKKAMTAGILNTMEAETGCLDYSKFQHYYDQVMVEQF